jgi:hypothetical protein
MVYPDGIIREINNEKQDEEPHIAIACETLSAGRQEGSQK